MGVPTRLALFATLLLAVFGGAALLGGALDPDGTRADTGAGATEAHDGGDHAEGGTAQDAAAPSAPPGLAVAQDGYRLLLEADAVARPGRTPLAFRIVDADGTAVRDFEVKHAKRLHLIVVRRDLTGFQHRHPTMAADGRWSVAIELPAAGTYRVYADFTIGGEQRTLGADLQVPGAYAPRALPAAAPRTTDDRGLEVRRRVGADGTVAFDVLRDGRVINGELEGYLGAKGHLVTLRAADLAYLHTHPVGDRLAFGVELPGPGTYRSWVQFQLAGVVHTAAFTQQEGTR